MMKLFRLKYLTTYHKSLFHVIVCNKIKRKLEIWLMLLKIVLGIAFCFF